MCYENTRSTKIGKRLVLQLGLNVLIDKGCNGCRFCKYPYTFQSVIRNEDGGFSKIVVRNDGDLWSYIHDLKQEALSFQKGSKSSIDVILDISEQLPFFVCKNKLIDEGFSNDIQRYTYCKESGQKPYPGTYGETPALWIQKFFLISNVLSAYKRRLEQKARKKQEIKMQSKNI